MLNVLTKERIEKGYTTSKLMKKTIQIIKKKKKFSSKAKKKENKTNWTNSTNKMIFKVK